LLLGEGLTLLGAVRCFGRAGIPAYVLTDPVPLAKPSRWFRALPGQSIHPHSYDELPALLARLELERAVLVPCSDPWAAAAGRLDPALAERFPSVVSTAEVIDLVIDKGRFAGVLAEADIPHPRTYSLAGRESLDQVPEGVFDRGFLKPRDSVAFLSAFGVKAFDFRSRGEAERLLDRAEAAGLSMLLQEYIPGNADQHYFIDGVIDRNGDFTVLFARRRLRIFPARFGNSTALVSIPLDKAEDAVASLRTLAPRIGLRGIFSAEFKHDPRDGRFKLIEVNARPWCFIEFAATCGADVCQPAYRDTLGIEALPHAPYRVGARLVYPYLDWLSWRRVAPRTCSLGELLKFWVGASQAVLCADDPMPAISNLARESRGWLARRATRVSTGSVHAS
jgi:predicted ATP-grasp superfamily ATP-dependent carboligase